EVGQYLDYVFPAFGIRFIAVQDNVDTENRDSNAMEMMPIMNVFNEWHAANTSKKIRAVWKAKANEGVFHGKKASYGYIKGTDAKRTLIIDEEVAPIVRRIFETYASGSSPRRIAEILNAEGIPCPGQYAFEKLGHKGKPEDRRLWGQITILQMLKNMVYIGNMPQLMSTSVSYKNHKRYKKDQSEWVVVQNTHEPIISQELWDKVREREKSVAQGRKTATGYTHPLSGFLFCADCGCKLKLNSTGHNKYAFNCGDHMRFGKTICFSHHISAKTLEKIILDDIRTMAQRIVLDEDAIRKEFERQNEELADRAVKSAKKELHVKRKRTEELSRLMQIAYEDRMKGKMPEDICIGFLQKYSEEQKTLAAEIAGLEAKQTETENKQQNADDFIRNIKKYLDAPELTREMCYELLDRVVVGGLPKITGKERTIDIVYKVDISSVIRYKFQK
ncbi:MAG: recombinase family protein, partial [Candidatus Scatosoma sp.]